MPNSTHERLTHERGEPDPTRWLSHAFIALLPVLACFLGGGTQKWGEGIVVALLGLYLLANPPRFSLGLTINLVLLALLISAAIAFLPASWFFQPAWRASYVNDFGISLPTTLSPQPWITLTCLFSFVAGLSWLYVVCAQQLVDGRGLCFERADVEGQHNHQTYRLRQSTTSSSGRGR